MRRPATCSGSRARRRPTWRAKYRLPDGHQVQKTLGPAWTYRGRPPARYFTKRTDEAWLRKTLVEAAAGTLPGMIRTGATVADACAEYLRYIEQGRQRKPPTLRDYDSIFRNHVPAVRSRRQLQPFAQRDPQRREHPRDRAVRRGRRGRRLHRLPSSRATADRAPSSGSRDLRHHARHRPCAGAATVLGVPALVQPRGQAGQPLHASSPSPWKG
jgi:hypothetical protein